ncbi:MAG TPA: hypothetical protein VFD84_18620 [Candidatus Binatia bacterium]|nr:hypothetical protein [Candidatus Binatia bacterium]
MPAAPATGKRRAGRGAWHDGCDGDTNPRDPSVRDVVRGRESYAAFERARPQYAKEVSAVAGESRVPWPGWYGPGVDEE